MSDLSKKLHSVIFGEKNTWDDWHLIPVARPFIASPSPKTVSIDIPSGNGEIDLSEVLTKLPVYSNRKDSLKFRFVDNPNYSRTLSRRNEIASYLHGKRMRMILEEEPEYYYYGRFALEDSAYKGKGDWADVEISYNLEPYKYSILKSTDNWLWDPFNFETGVIINDIFANITVDDNDTWVYINDLRSMIGDMAVVPKVITGEIIKVKRYDVTTGLWGTEFTFTSDIDYNPSFVINQNHTRLAIKGVGTVSFEFRTGRL